MIFESGPDAQYSRQQDKQFCEMRTAVFAEPEKSLQVILPWPYMGRLTSGPVEPGHIGAKRINRPGPVGEKRSEE